MLLITGTVGPGSEVITAFITSVEPSKLLDSDMILDPADTAVKATGLKTRSFLRLHKIGTIHVSSLQRRIGSLPKDLLTDVDSKLAAVLFRP